MAWQACFKKTGIELELLTDIDMLLTVEKKISGGICHAIHRYAKANKKYMKNYDKNKESSYIQYLDANSLHKWTMSQKLPVGGFKWKKIMLKFDEDFIKNYGEDSDKVHILEVDLDYSKEFHDLHSDFPFLVEKMEINKCNKLVCNLCNKSNYVVHIRTLKQVLDHRLILKKVHRVIEFNQDA